MVKKQINKMSISELKKERKIIATKLNDPETKPFSKSTQALLERDKKIMLRMSKP